MLIRIWCTTAAVVVVAGCKSDRPTAPRATEVVQDSRGPLNPALIASGQATFRSDTYGDETFWTDTLRMHEVIRTSVSPTVALSVGLKVDVDALPPAVKTALQNGTINLNDPATTVALLKLGAVLGVF
jgi:hypothetical protein